MILSASPTNSSNNGTKLLGLRLPACSESEFMSHERDDQEEYLQSAAERQSGDSNSAAGSDRDFLYVLNGPLHETIHFEIADGLRGSAAIDLVQEIAKLGRLHVY